MNALFEKLQKIEYEEFKIQASLHGAKFKEDEAKQEAKKNNLSLFQAPEEYEKMSEEERGNLTNQMMTGHRLWSGNALKGK